MNRLLGSPKIYFGYIGGTSLASKKCLLLKNPQYCCCGLLPMKMGQNYNWIGRYKPFSK